MIVITGASDGLGLQLAKVLTETGKSVINISRRESEYASQTVVANLENIEDINDAIRQIQQMPEPIDAFINCAGVLSFEAIENITSDEVDRVFNVNIKAPILLVSGLTSRLRQDKSDIVNVASTVGFKAYPEQAVYGSSKWAIRGFSQNLQLELKDTNRIISFCVGGFNSDIAKKVTGDAIPDPENWMNPADIAAFIKQILALPKNMEVTEIVINRKTIS